MSEVDAGRRQIVDALVVVQVIVVGDEGFDPSLELGRPSNAGAATLSVTALAAPVNRFTRGRPWGWTLAWEGIAGEYGTVALYRVE